MSSTNGNGDLAMTAQRTAQGPLDDPNPFKRSASPSVALAQLYERRSRSGRKYLVGRLGVAKVIVVATGEDSKGNPVWQMYLGETQYVPPGAAELAREVEAEAQA
jgi:hypothetical protein